MKTYFLLRRRFHQQLLSSIEEYEVDKPVAISTHNYPLLSSIEEYEASFNFNFLLTIYKLLSSIEEYEDFRKSPREGRGGPLLSSIEEYEVGIDSSDVANALGYYRP